MEKMRSGTVQGAAEGQIFTSAGLCCFSQSLSTASMRSSQLNPVAINDSRTEVEYSIVMVILPSLSGLLSVSSGNQAALPRVKSMWMSSYGKTMPLTPFSMTPCVMSFVTSECTARTSRFNRRALNGGNREVHK